MSEEEIKDKANIVLDKEGIKFSSNEHTFTLEEIKKLYDENTKLKNHIEMQDLTIQKLYAQLNNPPTTISSSGYFQADIPKYTLTYCNTADEENTKLKQDNQELKRIVDALEMAKQNMPKGTQFVIVAEEDYLRNIGIINERETNE